MLSEVNSNYTEDSIELKKIIDKQYQNNSSSNYKNNINKKNININTNKDYSNRENYNYNYNSNLNNQNNSNKSNYNNGTNNRNSYSSNSSKKTESINSENQKLINYNPYSIFDLIDPAMCFQSCYNHAMLINNVYPTNPGEEGAKTNNLSFLIFYAKSRPQKLIKIGAYLEKRAKRDIWNSKVCHVKVTLTILDALVNGCPQHMNLFSKNAINIFYDVLVSNLNLLPEVTNTFINFSSRHDHSILDIDDSFNTKYLQTLENFCKCCSFEDQDKIKQNKIRLNGLKAIHSTVSSNTFLTSPKMENFLIVIPALLENLLTIQKSRSSCRISSSSELAKINKAISTSKNIGLTGGTEINKLPNENDNLEMELEIYSLKSISELMQRVTPATFERLFSPIYNYLNEKDHWSHLHYLTKIFKITTESIQNQYRYLLVTSLFKRLNDNNSKNNIKTQSNVIFVLTYVITTSGNSIGLTTLELLDNLTKHLFLSVKNSKQYSVEDVEVLQSSIIDCIGSLARFIHYPDQINDMLSFLINRLYINKSKLNSTRVSQKSVNIDVDENENSVENENRSNHENIIDDSCSGKSNRKPEKKYLQELTIPNEKSGISNKSDDASQCSKKLNNSTSFGVDSEREELEEDSLVLYRIIIFKCLRRILENSLVSESTNTISQIPFQTKIPVEIIIPTFKFLLMEPKGQKIEYFFFLLSILQYTPNHSNVDSISQKQKNKIRRELHYVIYNYIQLKTNQLLDYVILLNLMKGLVNHYLFEEIFTVIPLIDKLQDLKPDNENIAEQIVYNSVIFQYCIEISNILKNDSLKENLNEIKNKRIENHHWIDLNYDLQDLESLIDKNYCDLDWDYNNLTPVEEYIDLDTVINCIYEDENLLKQFPDLKEQIQMSELTYEEMLESLIDNKNLNKNASSLSMFDKRSNRLIDLSISIPRIEPKLPSYIVIDDLKEVLDSTISPEPKIEDFTTDEVTNSNMLSLEISNLLNEITSINEMQNVNCLSGSPSKSITTLSTGITLVNSSPLVKYQQINQSPNGNNTNSPLLDMESTIKEENEAILDQSFYPKMEMSNTVIPNIKPPPQSLHSIKNPNSIYIKEPSLR